MPSSTRALLFDLDGTLVETIPYWLEANVQALAARDIVLDTETFLTDYYQQGLHFHGILEKAGSDLQNAKEWYEQRDDRYVHLMKNEIAWLPNVEETLRRLPSNLPLGLLTGSNQRFVDAIDERLHLSSIFRTIITKDDTGIERMKPDPYGLLLLAEKLSVEPSVCIYVGDQRVDVQAARAARMRSCVIPGAHSQPNVQAGADIVLKDIAGLPTVIGE